MKTLANLRKTIETQAFGLNSEEWDDLNKFNVIVDFRSRAEHLDGGKWKWNVVVGLYGGQKSVIEDDFDLYVGLNCLDNPNSDEIWLSYLENDNPRLFKEVLGKIKGKLLQ